MLTHPRNHIDNTAPKAGRLAGLPAADRRERITIITADEVSHQSRTRDTVPSDLALIVTFLVVAIGAIGYLASTLAVGRGF